MTSPSGLLDVPPYPADRYALLADRLKALLATKSDVVFVQAEAILALEAAAASLSRPGLVALNIITSPYGGYFGDWLRRAGADVHSVAAEPGRPITLEAVARALDRLPRVDLVAIVHAETSSGILNPLAEVAALGRAKGALLVVDAVASVGGHPLAIDELGIDVCVIGPQKALAGPAGLSALSVSPRAWAAMDSQAVRSSLALLDLKTSWLDQGRGALPGMPSALEFWALDAALTRVEDETLAACIARHKQAAAATRGGLRLLGVPLWIDDDAQASNLATTVRLPTSVDPGAFLTLAREHGAAVAPAFGLADERVVRLDHAGRRAAVPTVEANLRGVAEGLGAVVPGKLSTTP